MNTLFNCSLWGDEAFSAVLAQRPFWPMIQIVAKDTSPPLMYIIMWIWFRIFGSSEIAIRSLSLLFYIGTTILVYLIGKELFDKKTGIFSALLSFFNPFLFVYAFEGRMYFTLLFFVTLSTYFLIKKKELGYIIASSAVLYSHHFGIFAIMAQFIWQLIDQFKWNKKVIWSIIRPYLLIGVSYIPWIYPLYLQTTLVSTGFWLGRPELKHLIGVFFNFLSQKGMFEIQNYIPITLLIILAVRKWSKKDWSKDLLLVLLGIFPPVITFLISQTKLSIFYERYLLFCVPPLLILLASKTRKISFITLIFLGAVSSYVCWHLFTHPFKKPFREYAQWIKENSKDVFIVNYNGASHHLWEAKYYGIPAPIYSPGGPLPFYVGTAQMTDEDVVYQLPEDQKIGLISSTQPDSMEIDGYHIDPSYHQTGPLYFVLLTKDED